MTKKEDKIQKGNTLDMPYEEAELEKQYGVSKEPIESNVGITT